MKRTYQRGEMYYADLGRGVGSEQEGRRPVVIILSPGQPRNGCITDMRTECV